MTLFKPWVPKTDIAFEWAAPDAPPPPAAKAARGAGGKAARPEAAPAKGEDELISVCVTVFNYARYLDECLDSIKAQTYARLELVIVDDHSQKDDSVAVAAAWAEKHKQRFRRIAVYSHSVNQGPAEARNTAIRNATGEWIFIIDADNEAYPRAVQRLHAAAKSGGFQATYSQTEMFGECHEVGYADIWDPDEMRKKNYVDVMALVRRDALQQVEGFSHIDNGWEDYDFWLKFLDAGMTAAYVPEILCRYRVHNLSRTVKEAHVYHDDLVNLMAFRHPSIGSDTE